MPRGPLSPRPTRDDPATTLRFRSLLTTARALVLTGVLGAQALAAPAVAAEPGAAAAMPDDQANTAKWPMKVDLGLLLGYNGLSDETDLGNGNRPVDVPQASVLFGLRGTAWLMDQVGAELEAKVVPTSIKGSKGTGSATIFGVRGLAHYQLMPTEAFRPFVSLGYGMDIFSAGEGLTALNAKDIYVEAKKTDPDYVILAGAGFKWQALHRVGVRVDLRWAGGEGRDKQAIVSNFEGMLGVAYTLGGKPGDADLDGLLDPFDKCPDAAEDKDGFEDQDGCAELDNDLDQVADAEDKCPNEAEDPDGFEDYDGCPETDNDKDGIPDASDKCSAQAEDRDGFQDTDGCPELDNDSDKIPDAKDKCANAAEDVDGFQDEDGCPDPDDDGDGIADKADKCPREAEVKNGFQDTDGCKDELPADLVKVTGAPIVGVVFKAGALVEKASAAALQPVAQALVATEGVKVQIKVVSTAVDQPTAQARADAIKAFLVGRGVETERVDAVGESTVPTPEPGAKPVKSKGKPAPDTITVSVK